ncbi:hypothetical protein B0J15DRAFT_597075 [Fusarium solani]|uniref:Uncharacterized protein n=1 Tax=Fusarium solani TaxID=169388 RepID=A0A9P9K7K7_FUSSL|nr:uncharacterized protein B0J15DRAFT_597075 [Fusarium solani]KAH7246945.1 hypothetical protein B0J15DRAFT_597075 [Fusarium solani]
MSLLTSISTRYGIDAAVTDYTSWYSSINPKHYTEGWTWCGSCVPIHTQYLADKDGKLTKTAYGFISPDILEADGYRIISSMFIGGPKPTSPGPGSEECEAHDYHWHCPPGVEEPSYSPGDKPADGKNGSGDENDGGSGGPGEYQAHGDHWHCPEGVEEPSYAPDEAPGSEASGKPSAGAESNGRTPHGDHWHCPESVEEPTPPPPAGSSTLATVKEPAASSWPEEPVPTVVANEGSILAGPSTCMAVAIAFFFGALMA